MKKTFITSVMLAAAILTFNAVSNAPANAACPADKQCEQTMPAQKPEPIAKPLSPEEHAKIREAKKAEFEARLKFTEEQKKQIDELKANEEKSLKSCRNKIKKEQQKLDKLITQERTVREENIKKFEAILTEEQKAELKKLHEEMVAEKMKFKPCPCDCGCPACGKPHEELNEKDCGLKGPEFGPGPKGPEFGPGPKGPHHGPELAPQQAPDAPNPAPEEAPAAI